MEKLEMNLKNCFGIKELSREFSYENSNVNSIYARNGLMKTSLTKVFKSIQDSKTEEIGDKIFGCKPVNFNIKIDDNEISPNDVFVINSYESYYETEYLNDLLINADLKSELNELLKEKSKLLKKIEKKSGIKISRSSGGKKVYDLEPTIIKDLNLKEKSILINLDDISKENKEYDFSNIKYSSIFSETSLKKIKSEEFQNKIDDYLTKSNEIYEEFTFLEKGKFGIGKLKEISKGFGKNTFFVRNNTVSLDGGMPIKSITDLNDKIGEVEAKIHTSEEFKQIEKLLSDVSGRELKEIIENNSEIISELKVSKLELLRKKMWISYFKSEQEKVLALIEKYNTFEEKITNANIDDTPWKDALNIFESRFTVPYKMEIENIKSSIIGESVPQVRFAFCKDGNFENKSPSNWVKFDRSKLESINTLSQGEKRALYLLNVIFDIEKLRKDGNEVLLIVDDIADSFDYKNKYAIVEYLKEISEYGNFYLLVFSHNFDFYRTVSGRLDMKRENKFYANKVGEKIVVEQEYYQDKPFVNWIKKLDKKNTVALIPFVRNLIEYGFDKRVNTYSSINKDYLLLTNLLHFKENHTTNIEISHIKPVYKEYIGNHNFIDNIKNDEKLYDIIICVADNITQNDVLLEDKIIVSIAIRFIAERFMMTALKSYSGDLSWRKGKSTISGNSTDFLNYISSVGNQTRQLFNGFSQIGLKEQIKILDKVNIMTPEMIHINSFMYEPILDMDIVELRELYQKVKSL